EFMLSTFGDYAISARKLLSPSSEWSAQYRRLAGAVTTIRGEQEVFAREQAGVGEQALQQLRSLGSQLPH
ncbi:MAG TPA: hypothetical protein VMX54_06800, partial [Vicinamibacteria bacterium]|nr:hypothetical protein [Vicinamibacteria bacterium]